MICHFYKPFECPSLVIIWLRLSQALVSALYVIFMSQLYELVAIHHAINGRRLLPCAAGWYGLQASLQIVGITTRN
jgi:hypothetical protein